MFTGIIEAVGILDRINEEGSAKHFCFNSAISKDLKIGQSIAHNGVCLTVTKQNDDHYWVMAVEETLSRSNLAYLKKGNKVNLERSMLNHGRFDGHLVQGHVDQIGTCTHIKKEGSSRIMDFSYNPSLGNSVIEKGSIAVDGLSLTCFNTRLDGFTVAVIPHTLECTTFGQLDVQTLVNLEFDMIGKYVQKLLAKQSK